MCEYVSVNVATASGFTASSILSRSVYIARFARIGWIAVFREQRGVGILEPDDLRYRPCGEPRCCRNAGDMAVIEPGDGDAQRLTLLRLGPGGDSRGDQAEQKRRRFISGASVPRYSTAARLTVVSPWKFEIYI